MAMAERMLKSRKSVSEQQHDSIFAVGNSRLSKQRVAQSLPEDLREPQMTGHGAKYGRKKEEAIAALLSQRKVEEAARVVGIAPKTLLRWLKVPEFKEAYLQARSRRRRFAWWSWRCVASNTYITSVASESKAEVRFFGRKIQAAAVGLTNRPVSK